MGSGSVSRCEFRGPCGARFLMREQLHDLVNRPPVARNACRHSGSAPTKRAMWPRKVVVHEVQRNGCLKVLKLLGESICQSSESAHGHAHGEIRPLDVAGGHAVQVGLPHDSPALTPVTLYGE